MGGRGGLEMGRWRAAAGVSGLAAYCTQVAVMAGMVPQGNDKEQAAQPGGRERSL